ncbi:MAG: bifunctional riboflavin kinase/FAD synthetase [Syntrophomonadaceae bacterium]|nr:bifunctional riboflavin kinase/FAD synthetase [Syntrophomonadaceae bacterium]
MEIIRDIDNFISNDKPLYLALGNFDGVHRGHQKLISELVQRAKSNQGRAAAFIFEPHPGKVLSPERAPKMLATPERQAELLREAGLDVLIYNAFTRDIAHWSPEEFVERILVKRLRIQEAFVGFNYSFGHKGAGTPDMLQQMGSKHHFKVNIIAPVEVDGEVVSSSLVRKALDRGDIEFAHRMLGYYPMIEGQVIKGEQRGSAIGFPTANLGIIADLNVPAKGVYAAKAVLGSNYYKAAVNIGSKPTFHTEYPVSIEAHLIDFNQEIYGEQLRLYFVHKIRDEKKFNGIDELVQQINLDRDKAREIVSLKI